MSSRDLHSALKTQTVDSSVGSGVQFVLVSLQDGKDDIRYSLHAAPTSYTMSGIQITDYLAYLGFERGQCAFVRGECYSRSSINDFDLSGFASAFSSSFSKLNEAESHLDKCGFFLPQPEGWGYFTGKSSGTDGKRHSLFTGGGNGHTAQKSVVLKTSDDEYFHFALTFLSGSTYHEKGWVYHYRPIHAPLSPEIQGVLKFLRLQNFLQCPIFEFEPCFWRFIEFDEDENDFFSRRTSSVHDWFGAHADHFSRGIESLLEAQRILQPFAMSFISVEDKKPEQRDSSMPTIINQVKPEVKNRKRTVVVDTENSSRKKTKNRKHKYDVAISFAGTERKLAEKLANLIRAEGIEVFYDDFYPEQLWGKDLFVLFDNIYRKEAKYCVIFVSEEYCDRMWTTHERRSAQARLLEEKGAEYILPIQVDNAELPGMAPTISHLSLKNYSIEKISEFLLKKLQNPEELAPPSKSVSRKKRFQKDQVNFTCISLEDTGLVNNDLDNYKSPPFGDYKWHQVIFNIQNVRISMGDISNSQSKFIELGEPIFGVRAAHFIINVGDGKKKYLKYEIGRIDFVFENDEPPYSYCQIILGKNVREWAIGNYVRVSDKDRSLDPLVKTAEDKELREAWRGETRDGQVAVMDMLTIPIDPSKNTKRLLGIKLTRIVSQNAPSLDYFVSGITLETNIIRAANK